MSFDLTIVDESPELIAAHQKALTDGFGADWDGYFAVQQRERAHFGRNNRGWGILCSAMGDLGMLFEVPADRLGHFPQPGDFGCRKAPYTDPGGRTSLSWTERDPNWRAYEAAVVVHLRKEFEHPGIPVHKLGDNSGWHVTPREIRSALERYRDALDNGRREPDCDRWDEWIEWLIHAAEKGGFRVR